MGQALYRKYRSRSFDEVVGQEHIVTTLKNAIKAGRISHAYLFTGPRGVGKTSVARILAHVVNDLPYEGESMHLDIIEIDAASNRRIDEIRDLRDRVHIAPSSAKYKVYIIDEVHMLTKEAFNALLKTLEEPPAHCIFILATTEVHKVPETIISRTQRFHFKPISRERAVAHLRTLAEKEGITISSGALELLARHGDGSFRDSISLLDQVRSSGKNIEEADVEQALGIPAESAIGELYQLLHQGQAAGLMSFLDTQISSGFSPQAIAERLSAYLRSNIIGGTAHAQDLQLLKSLLEISASTRPAELLEIVLLEYNNNQNGTILSDQPKQDDAKTTKNDAKTSTKATDVKPEKPQSTARIAEETNEENVKPETKNHKPASASNRALKTEDWNAILAAIETRSSALYRALRMAKAEVIDNVLELHFAFSLHKKKVELSEHKQLLTQIITEEGYAVPEISLEVDKSVKPAAVLSAKTNKNDDTTDTISNIFGGAELLES